MKVEKCNMVKVPKGVETKYKEVVIDKRMCGSCMAAMTMRSDVVHIERYDMQIWHHRRIRVVRIMRG